MRILFIDMPKMILVLAQHLNGISINILSINKKKIIFLFSAMRHFAEDLKESRYKVEYTKLDDKHNTKSFRGEIECIIQKYNIVVVTYPGEYRVLADILEWNNDFGVFVEIREDNRFLYTPNKFDNWGNGKKKL